MREREVEFILQFLIGFFREMGTMLGELLHFGIVIDIEVFGLEDVPVEVVVLDLIAAEMEVVLCRCGQCDGECHDEEEDVSQACGAHR